MYKYLIGLFLCTISWYVSAQNRDSLANEITARLDSFKQENKRLQIEFLDSIYGTPFINLISQENISKDSLRHLLVDHGFYDFDFELFYLKIKKADDLDKNFLKHKNPKLFKLLSDSTFNKETYSFEKSAKGITLFLVLSKNDIVVDKVKRMFDGFMPGAEIHTRTFKAYSIKKNIVFCEEKSYSDLVKKRQIPQYDIKLDDNNYFEVTIHFSSSLERKYVGIKDSSGKMLSVIKL